jgi:peptide/nickel transport system substrate-binding protein/oligopeptide transport system substrate-binding protein
LLLTSLTLSAAETPKQAGTLRLARISDPVTLDPLGVTMSEDWLLIPLLHQALLDVKDLTNVVPWAARDWSASADKQLYTFRLRPGVKFSNGREVLAADDVFTLERLLNPTNSYSMISSLQAIRGADDFGKGRAKHVAGLGAPASDTLTRPRFRIRKTGSLTAKRFSITVGGFGF